MSEPNEPMYDTMLETLKNLRARQEKLKEETKAMLDAIKSTPAYISASTELDDISKAIEVQEKQIRDAAIEEFNATGTKKVHPKVEVKVFQKFTILDPVRVLVWVKTNLADALVYDEKKVKNYVAKIGLVDGTELVEEPRAQIATEL